MSFEKLYEKYRNGTASEEEIAYVEEEIAKARKLGEILEAAEKEKGAILTSGEENEKSAAHAILADADAEQVKKARKKHRLRSSVLTLCISLLSAALVACAVAGAIFGTAIGSAKKNAKITETQAKTIALEYYSAN